MKGVFKMKTKMSVKKIISVLAAVLLSVSFSGCGEEKDSRELFSESQKTELSSQETDNQSKQNSDLSASTEAQEMCWGCGKVPVTGTNIYCADCKCLVCNNRRKIGNYLYCSLHNCNESGCNAMAVKNSQYCVTHKCAMPNCRNKAWSGSQYCATHK